MRRSRRGRGGEKTRSKRIGRRDGGKAGGEEEEKAEYREIGRRDGEAGGARRGEEKRGVGGKKED